MNPTREQMSEAIHEAGDGVAHVSDQYESALADAVMALLDAAQQPPPADQVALVESWGWQRRTFWRPNRASTRTEAIVAYEPPTVTEEPTDAH